MTARQVFDGSPTTGISGTGTVADGGISVGGTNATITEINNTGAGDLWPYFRAVGSFSFATATGIDGKTIDLYVRKKEIDGASVHEDAPSLTDLKSLHYVGSFVLNEVTSQQAIQIEFDARGLGKFEPYVQNNAGQTLDADFVVKLEGISVQDVA